MPIRLALINDYEVVVRGLADMLRPYASTIQIVELLANAPVEEQVDIALYDTFARDEGTSSTVRELVANPRVDRVVIYSWNADDGKVRASLAHGAVGHLSKTLSANELVAALEAVHEGREVARTPERGGRGKLGDWPGRKAGLTPREAEVIALITQGLANKEIVERTGLSINSIKSYIRTGYRKIGAASRSQAVLWGVEHGMRPDRISDSTP